MKCRFCSKELIHSFLDLGYAPPSNAYLTSADLSKPETYYPLRVKVCDGCWLVQTEDYAEAGELFDAEYAYFSSTSKGWLAHAAEYTRKILDRLELSGDSFVVEVAANDGYLLKNFLSAGVPCIGIEPTASTAAVAEKLGLEVIREFFSESLGAQMAERGQRADLLIGNNVYAHVPDIKDFTRGIKQVLKKTGTVTLEFPHLLKLIEYGQFDTVYHEHFSYLSLATVASIFESAGLRVYDVEELATHGGSLRIYGCHDVDPRTDAPAVEALLNRERECRLQCIETYLDFQEKAERIKNELLDFLLDAWRRGKRVVAYGAAAKGNTLLNFAGVKPDLIPFVCDAAPAKQGKFMPGSHIPILPPSELAQCDTDYILVLPWNIADEVTSQLSASQPAARFVTAVPHLEIR